ncbi:MAG: D-glycero-beta-D-manno-heptose-7-phosphate kinase [Calditrichaeota bacterium]|nr:D-glycero-beta-D-manno-heptose-7-phosphate kinase [Calditrichota bacterium]
MLKFSESRLQEILERGRGKRIMVVGDLMVDRYLWGTVSRLSPEAPVPIINIEDEEIRFGGAANVANNVISLGATPIVVGVVGKDHWGQIFKSMLLDRNLRADGLVEDASRPTTLKTRIIGNNQHIARVDREVATPIADDIQQKILQFVADQMDSVDAIILQDYNKGILVPPLIHQIVDLAEKHAVLVTVDPKFDNFLEYRKVTLFKPNKRETEEALAMRLNDEARIRKAGTTLIERLKAQAVLITLGEKGMALFEANGQVAFTGTRARKVADVSGAGDTVIATVTFALAAGANMREAVTLANYAAGVVCEEVGVVPIDRDVLKKTILTNQHLFDDSKTG